MRPSVVLVVLFVLATLTGAARADKQPSRAPAPASPPVRSLRAIDHGHTLRSWAEPGARRALEPIQKLYLRAVMPKAPARPQLTDATRW